MLSSPSMPWSGGLALLAEEEDSWLWVRWWIMGGYGLNRTTLLSMAVPVARGVVAHPGVRTGAGTKSPT